MHSLTPAAAMSSGCVSGWARVAAILEVMGILAAAELAVYWFHYLPHVPDVGSMMRSAAGQPSGGVQGIYLAAAMLLHLTFRGVAFFALVLAVGRLRRYRAPFRYGLTTRGRPVAGLLAVALLAFCAAELPTKMLAYASHFHLFPAGGGNEFYLFLLRPWPGAFWVLYVLAMCVVVPIQEEFFVRGYAQTRLQRQWGAPAAILIAALFFTAHHLGGYLYRVDARNVTELLAMCVSSLGLGYVYWRTRSIWPGVVMHGLGNFPLRVFATYVVLTLAMATVLVVFRKRWVKPAGDFVRRLSGMGAGGAIAALCVLALTVYYEVSGLPMMYVMTAVLLAVVLLGGAGAARRRRVFAT
jgi:membrane protease YdiL (CAAX protease family)